MPPQHIEVAETIIALKRALRREKEAPSDQPISSATNRGNKLKKGANYVHAGSLPYRYGIHGYKERIEHAGYQRYILEPNPKRFNEYGDELEESESDEEADADAEDENPYGDIRLEELLRPLTHPAELATHPTMSIPYLDNALLNMVRSTEAQLRDERANLWRAKNLHKQFIGDESWMPCENVEAADDWDLFQPQQRPASSSSSKKRKRGNEERSVENGVHGKDYAAKAIVSSSDMKDTSTTNGVTKSQPEDVSQLNTKHRGITGDNYKSIQTNGEDAGEPGQAEDDTEMAESDGNVMNGVSREEHKSEQMSDKETTEIDNQNATDNTTSQSQNQDRKDTENQSGNENEETPPPPTRRITRALAAADTSNALTPPMSPTTSTISTLSSSLLLRPAPLFLLPPHLILAHSNHPTSHLPMHVAHSGLPVDEILETRRLLGMYIQKQEETIRGLEGVLSKLIKAKRMKEKVWEWCNAEGHVGEWSDGEDWIDAEAWGLRAEELRKGRDEEEQEVQEEGRKGKRRRGRE